MSNIIPNLYLGDVHDALAVSQGDNPLNITRMITVSKELAAHIHPDPAHVQHLVIEVNDAPTEDLRQYFYAAIGFIDQGLRKNERTLVHCYAGISRSSTIVLAYMLHEYPYMSLNAALNHVRSARPIVNPNPGFMYQLAQFENDRDDFISNESRFILI